MSDNDSQSLNVVSNDTHEHQLLVYYHVNNQSVSSTTRTEVAVWFAISMFICGLGFMTSALMLAATAVNKKLRIGSGILISHLLFLQLTICFIFFPAVFLMTYMAQNKSPLHVNCSAWQLLALATGHVESWTGFCLAVNRFVAVLFPTHYKRLTSKQAIVFMIVICWLIGFGLNLPFCYEVYGSSLATVTPLGYCHTKVSEGPFGYAWSWLGSYVPMILIGSIYLTVFVVIRFPGKKVIPETPQQQIVANVAKRRIVVAKMLLVAFLWHCFCYFPLTILAIFYRDVYLRHVALQYWTRTLYVSGYAVNPLIFFVLSKDYQDAVRELFRGMCKSRIGLQAPQKSIQLNSTAINQAILIAKN